MRVGRRPKVKLPNCQCTVCHKPLYRIPSRFSDHPCCSIACRNKYFSGDKSFVWKGGVSKDLGYINKRLRVSEKKRRAEYKQKAVSILGGICKVCGYSKCIASLQFHHIDRDDKDATVKDLMCGSWEKIEREIKKCILVCANCHFEIHYAEKVV